MISSALSAVNAKHLIKLTLLLMIRAVASLCSGHITPSLSDLVLAFLNSLTNLSQRPACGYSRR
jgi:hypothetical protein